jgi:tRNA(Ile)-lysidine synthase
MKTARTYRHHPLVNQVACDLEKTERVLPSHRLLVAVSGGPDSVCLLAVLDELRNSSRFPGLALHVAHMNYGLRGKESDDDEGFVTKLATELGVPVTCERVNLVHAPGESLQAQARELRYAFFDRLRHDHNLSMVATGHTADDQAETVLMWLLRGAGVKGLAGMPALRQGWILRPLLHISRSTVLDYLAAQGICYRSDSSNRDRHYERNRIRHELMPLLRTFNPQITDTLARAAEVFAEDALLLEELEQERWPKVVRASDVRHVAFDIHALRGCSPGLQRRLIRRAWMLVNSSERGLNFRHVTAIMRKLVLAQHRSSLDLPFMTRARRHGALLILERTPSTMRRAPSWASGVSLAIPGHVVLDAHRRIEANLACDDVHSPQEGQVTTTSCAIDLDRVGSPLVVRSRRPGDWFCPTGMRERRKKVQDFFVDQKVPREDRKFVPIVASPKGIVWIAGYRGDERARPRPDTVHVVTLVLHEEAS